MREALGAPLDPVEIARGYLSSFAYVSSVEAKEVHVQRLRWAFDKIGLGPKRKYGMGIIEMMREAQDLGHGYWFPTPTRVVDFEDLNMIVSSSPTSELIRRFPSTIRSGFSRLVLGSEVTELPRQPLSDWMGFTPTSTVAWMQRELELTSACMGQTFVDPATEFFSVVDGGLPRESFRITWTTDPSRAISQDGLVLCRVRLGRNSARRFIGQLTGGKLTCESNHATDFDRMALGLLSLSGRKLRCYVEKSEMGLRISTELPLPGSERRLLCALAIRDFSRANKSYRFTRRVAPVLLGALRRLGFSTE